MDTEVIAFREKFNGTKTTYRYGWHILATAAFTLIPAAYSFAHVSSWSLDRWGWILGTVLISSFYEYWVHRLPLHRPMWPLKQAYQHHTLMHHYYFTENTIVAERAIDIRAILFPAWGVAIVVALNLGVAAYLLGQFISADLGWVVMGVGGVYFFLYEAVHFSCHLPEKAWVFSVPLLGHWLFFMREHHRVHHAKKYMARNNFNVVIPVFDYVFGSRRAKLM